MGLVAAIAGYTAHLSIARELSDAAGEARAAWSLGNAFTAAGQPAKAAYFAMLHMSLSKQVPLPTTPLLQVLTAWQK